MIQGNVHFRCRLIPDQCSANSLNGARCKKTTVIGTDICWQHLRNNKHLRILDTQHGKGLFAEDPLKLANAVVFEKNTKIIGYGGETIDEDDLMERYGNHTAPYGVKIRNEQFSDGSCKRGVGTLANHGNSKEANARFGFARNGEISLYSEKKIKNNEEILINYNKGITRGHPNYYLLSEPGITHRTMNVR